MSKKKTYEFEVALSVSDYWEAKETGDDEEAFANCKEDFESALQVAREELTKAGFTNPTAELKILNFVEFDSGNPSHAGGYFLAELSGNKEVVEEAEKLHTKWLED